MINAGNFINRDWGVVKIPTATNILKYEGLSLPMEKLLHSHFHSRQEQLHLLNHTKIQQVLVQDGK
jgi:hypothetical protein